jgi:hypothetical protein
LCDDAVADGEQGEGPERRRPVHAQLSDADDPARQYVDQQDDDARDRVALHELAGAVHRAVESGLFLEVLAPSLCLILIDQAHIKIGVDAHLLARHRIEHEACRHFRDALGARRHHHILDDDQDEEDDEADDVASAHREGADRVDDVACVGVGEDEAGRGDVERQPKQGRDQ